MNPFLGPYIDVEVEYRRERLSADYDKSRSRHHHPVRAVARAISRVHHRLEGV